MSRPAALAALAALRRYEDNLKLNLEPHRGAGNPQGSLELPSRHAVVRIERLVHGGPDHDNQSFLGKVIKTPSADHNVYCEDRSKLYLGQLLLVKIIDTTFFEVDPMFADMVTPTEQRAHESFLDESSALHHLHGKGFTGFPHIIPRFYGTWVHKAGEGNTETNTRVMLMEYIWGHSIKSLSHHQRREGYLIALPGKQDLPIAQNSSKQLILEERTRLRILKHLLLDYVELLRHGVKRSLEARDIFITLNDDNGNQLSHPRPVLLRHKLTSVSPRTVWAKMEEWSAQHSCTKFNKPLHPFEIYTWDFISDLVGWLPEEWRGRDDAYKFEGWLLLEFGRIDDDSSVQRHSILTTEELVTKCTGTSDSHRKERLKQATAYCSRLDEQARLYRDELAKHAEHPPEQSTGSKRPAVSPPATGRASKRLRSQSMTSDPASSNSDEGGRRSDSEHGEYKPPSTEKHAKPEQPQAFDEKYDLIHGGCPKEVEQRTGDPAQDQLAAPYDDHAVCD